MGKRSLSLKAFLYQRKEEAIPGFVLTDEHSMLVKVKEASSGFFWTEIHFTEPTLLC